MNSLPQAHVSKYDRHSASLIPIYNAKQVLENEAKVAASENIAMFDLMTQAGTVTFNKIAQFCPTAKNILVLCGKGNNGGDGFIIARLAQLAGIKVEVLVTCVVTDLKSDAKTAYQSMVSAGVSDIRHLSSDDLSLSRAKIKKFSGDVIIDALFGIGFYGILPSDIRQLVNDVNQHKAPVLSVDVPSGLCATTGSVNLEFSSVIVANVTVTFIVYKQGLLTGQAANYVGKLILEDLTLGNTFIQQVPSNVFYQQTSNINKLPNRLPTSHKGDIGLLLCVGSFIGMPGAIRLASEAALRCGAALVSVCCHQQNQALVFNGRPEMMLAPTDAQQLAKSSLLTKAKALLIGPGLGREIWSKQLFDLLISSAIEQKKTIIIDADALYFLSQSPLYYSHWILTPHPKEAANLLDCSVADIEADRFAAVHAITKKYGGVCLLKGAGTLLCNGKKIVINSTGNAGMASGGMGDVLSGIITALILQSNDNFIASCSAAYIHGAAADIIADKYGQRGMLASDLFVYLQQLINQE